MLIMSSLVAQAVTLPTAALAVETGPLGGKSERTEGMPREVCRTESDSNIRPVSLL